VRLYGRGGTEMLHFEAALLPRVGDQDVLVHVCFCGLNHSDLNLRQGSYYAVPNSLLSPPHNAPPCRTAQLVIWQRQMENRGPFGRIVLSVMDTAGVQRDLKVARKP
jgi:hypothetical protein